MVHSVQSVLPTYPGGGVWKGFLTNKEQPEVITAIIS